MHVESNVLLCPVSLKSSKIQWSHAAAPFMPWFSSGHSVCVWCGGLQNFDFLGFIPGLFPPFLLCEEVGSSPPCPLHRDRGSYRCLIWTPPLQGHWQWRRCCCACVMRASPLTADSQLLQKGDKIQVAGQAPLRR